MVELPKNGARILCKLTLGRRLPDFNDWIWQFFYYLTIYHRMYKFCYSLVIKKVGFRARDHFCFHYYVLKTLFSLSINNWFDKYSISIILLKKTKLFWVMLHTSGRKSFLPLKIVHVFNCFFPIKHLKCHRKLLKQ